MVEGARDDSNQGGSEQDTPVARVTLSDVVRERMPELAEELGSMDIPIPRTRRWGRRDLERN